MMKKIPAVICMILTAGVFCGILADCTSAPQTNATSAADELYKEGAYPEALEAYTKTIVETGGTWMTFNNRGITYAAMGQYDKALTDINEALKLNPKSVAALNNRGNIHYRLNDKDAAVADYDQALSIAPNNETIQKNRDLVTQGLDPSALDADSGSEGPPDPAAPAAPAP